MDSVSFDPAKNASNIARRGISLERVADFDWVSAMVAEDRRRDYGETRLRIFGLLDGRLHIAVVTPRGDGLRVISLRKANSREVRLYEQQASETQRD